MEFGYNLLFPLEEVEETGRSALGYTIGGTCLVVSLKVATVTTTILTFLCRHVLTGLAAYYLLTWGVYLRYCLDGRMDEVGLVWPSLWTSMPTVEKRDKI